jgi:IS5 family transposase
MQFSYFGNQTSLLDFKIMGYEFPKEHELVKLEAVIPWEELIEIVAKKYSSLRGRNSKSIRMMIALEIVKRKYQYSDVELVEKLQTDVAIMHFCGFTQLVNEAVDASSMTKFRNRFDEKTLALLEDASIKKFIRKAPRRKIHQVISDTTCVEANITYPTDTKLLTKVYSKMAQIIDKGREKGIKVVIRGRRKLMKLVRAFNLKRKKSIKTILKMRNTLVRAGQKVLKKAEGVVEKIKQEKAIGVEKLEYLLKTGRSILDQQKELAIKKAKRIAGRIVSFHAPEIRPIFRGKEKQQTEFGQKVAVSIVGGGLMMSTKLAHDNFSDTTISEISIDRHTKVFNRKPTEFIADRGYHSPQNHEKLKEMGIRDGIQWRGKIPKKVQTPSAHEGKRMYRQRSVVEAKIGTMKTKYGWSKNYYKDANCGVLVTFGLIAMNADWTARRT